ncbi:MAG TPA: phospho-sugar mutase [Clostridia bacterium]|nr:phospho-sugar mutase [Clostridia bacterium]
MYRELYDKWLHEPALGETLRAELVKIENDEKEKEERFYTELTFGTAGLRGILGAGTNRMNVHVVRRATQGLAQYLKTCGGACDRGVAIAYDSRHMSAEFAKETALVLAQNGVRVYLFESLRPVPLLSFTLRHNNCIAGIVITASHNPPQYNGYKVYWEDGGQCGPKQADEILKEISSIPYFTALPMDEARAKGSGFLTMIGTEADEAYYAATQTLLLYPALLKQKGKELNIVYTPLHGSGRMPVLTLLSRVGVTSVSVVKEQELPDGAFPTVSAPNPEDPNALKLALELAQKVNADVVIGTDPDADRLGVAVRPKGGTFKVLTGNQIGSLLIHYLLSSLTRKRELPKNGLVVKSIVSTRMADAVCAQYNVRIEEVLTGFRFISEKIEECDRTGERKFLFGFEESFGFLAGGFSRDKDAVCAAMLLSEACVYYREQNKTLYDVLEEMYALYGYYMDTVKSYTLMGKEGVEKIQSAMQALRENPIQELGGLKVQYAEDFIKNERINMAVGTMEPIGLPHSDVLRYILEGGAWVCVRPSGTEPKLKIYIGVNAPSKAEADAQKDKLVTETEGLIKKLFA